MRRYAASNPEEERSILDSIDDAVDENDVDARRLVYADYLEEHGKPAAAELIRKYASQESGKTIAQSPRGELFDSWTAHPLRLLVATVRGSRYGRSSGYASEANVELVDPKTQRPVAVHRVHADEYPSLIRLLDEFATTKESTDNPHESSVDDYRMARKRLILEHQRRNDHRLARRVAEVYARHFGVPARSPRAEIIGPEYDNSRMPINARVEVEYPDQGKRHGVIRILSSGGKEVFATTTAKALRGIHSALGIERPGKPEDIPEEPERKARKYAGAFEDYAPSELTHLIVTRVRNGKPMPIHMGVGVLGSMLVIRNKGKDDSYQINEHDGEPGAARNFTLQATDAAEPYVVTIHPTDNRGDTCTCKGYQFSNYCKHEAAVRGLIELGKMPDVKFRDEGGAPEQKARKYAALNPDEVSELHREIARNLYDPTPHLVYADYLEEHGEPWLAGMIRKNVTEPDNLWWDPVQKGGWGNSVERQDDRWQHIGTMGGMSLISAYEGREGQSPRVIVKASTDHPKIFFHYTFELPPHEGLEFAKQLAPEVGEKLRRQIVRESAERGVNLDERPEQKARSGVPARYASHNIDEMNSLLKEAYDTDDETPHLVLADYLEEHGMPTAAGIIRDSLKSDSGRGVGYSSDYIDKPRLGEFHIEAAGDHVGFVVKHPNLPKIQWWFSDFDPNDEAEGLRKVKSLAEEVPAPVAHPSLRNIPGAFEFVTNEAERRKQSPERKARPGCPVRYAAHNPQEEAEFLRAIAANPSDWLPRLVYADWLEEHESPEIAHQIRIEHDRRGHKDIARRLADAWLQQNKDPGPIYYSVSYPSHTRVHGNIYLRRGNDRLLFKTTTAAAGRSIKRALGIKPTPKVPPVAPESGEGPVPPPSDTPERMARGDDLARSFGGGVWSRILNAFRGRVRPRAESLVDRLATPSFKAATPQAAGLYDRLTSIYKQAKANFAKANPGMVGGRVSRGDIWNHAANRNLFREATPIWRELRRQQGVVGQPATTRLHGTGLKLKRDGEPVQYAAAWTPRLFAPRLVMLKDGRAAEMHVMPLEGRETPSYAVHAKLEGGPILGMGPIYFSGDKAHLHPVVFPEYRRLGVASHLYDFASDVAEAHGATLHATAGATPAAKGVWEKRGARQMARWCAAKLIRRYAADGEESENMDDWLAEFRRKHFGEEVPEVKFTGEGGFEAEGGNEQFGELAPPPPVRPFTHPAGRSSSPRSGNYRPRPITHDWTRLNALLGSRSSRVLARNKYLQRGENGDIQLYLHRTPVVTAHSDGSHTIRTGGWGTPTTKKFIKQYSPHSMYTDASGRSWLMTPHGEYVFFEGMRIGPDGRLQNPEDNPRRGPQRESRHGPSARRYAAVPTSSYAGAQGVTRSANQNVRADVARDIATTLGLTPAAAQDVVHDHSRHGSRPALALRLAHAADRQDKVRYAGAWLGLITKQPGQVVFTPGSGEDLLHTFTTDAPMDDVRRLLDRSGVTDRVAVPSRGKTTLVVYDRGARLSAGLRQLTDFLGVRLQSSPGVGRFIGAPMGKDYRAAFRRIIRDYEAKYAQPPAEEQQAAPEPAATPPDMTAPPAGPEVKRYARAQADWVERIGGGYAEVPAPPKPVAQPAPAGLEAVQRRLDAMERAASRPKKIKLSRSRETGLLDEIDIVPADC